MTVTFDATNPILWSGLGAGEWPTWIDPIPPAQGLSDGNTVLTFSIPLPLNGQASGFQFVLDVGGVTVTSPDPILVNATIGDGGQEPGGRRRPEWKAGSARRGSNQGRANSLGAIPCWRAR